MNGKLSRLLLWFRSRPAWVWLAVILIFSFLMKVLYRFFDPVISRDGTYYIHLAQIWYDTGNFQDMLKTMPNVTTPPFFFYMMTLLMRFGISAETAGVGINIVLGTFTPLLTFLIAYEVLQRKDIAVCSALLIAVSPSMNKLSVEVQRDMIYLFFIGLALWLLIAGIRRRQWLFMLGGGIAAGFSMLIRYETLELLVILPASLIFLLAVKYLSWKKCFQFFGVFFVGFVVVLYAMISLMQIEDYSHLKKIYMIKTMSVVKYFYGASDGEPEE